MRSFVPVVLAVAILLACVAAPAESQITGVRRGAFTADGKRLTGLGKLPSDTVVFVNGKSTTAGKLRHDLHVLALRNLGKPTAFIPKGKISTIADLPRVPMQSVIAALSSPSPSPSPDFRLKLARQDYVPVPTPTPASGTRSKFERIPLPIVTSAPTPSPEPRPVSKDQTPDPNFCNTHDPIIQHVKGSVTPGGYVVVEGLCLGTSGTIELKGTFGNGLLALTVQNWSDTSITAAIPQVSGVYDQTVKLQVTNVRKPSNDVALQFTATRVILPLPSHFITNVSCSGGANPGDNASSTCTAATASHWAEDAGTDTWQAQLPTGWTLTSLELSTGLGTINGTEGFFAQPPSAEKWSVSWQGGPAGTEDQDSLVFGIFISTTTVQVYSSSYAMTLYAIGPAGTMPQ